jgi:predicted DNA-binding protein (MmcQ/YjbR family)
VTPTLPPAGRTILRRALAYPGAKKEMPWGDIAVKVNGKAFIFMGMTDGEFGLSVKLPSSGLVALNLSFASPTGYGLGKAGWVSARFKKSAKIPVELLMMWVDESYRAIAPKRLSATLDEEPAAKKKKTKTVRSRTPGSRRS